MGSAWRFAPTRRAPPRSPGRERLAPLSGRGGLRLRGDQVHAWRTKAAHFAETTRAQTLALSCAVRARIVLHEMRGILGTFAYKGGGQGRSA